MKKEVLKYNWIPDSFEHFCTESRDELVGLNIMDDQYSWLRQNIPIPRPSFLKKLVTSDSSPYEERLLKLMASDERVYRQVHDRGIDLVLYRKEN